MTFISVQDEKNEEWSLNPRTVTRVSKMDETTSVICFTDGSVIQVLEPYRKLMSRLRKVME